jgi:hypothetical protein
MSDNIVFPKPTSLFICGNDRSLLNWVAYAVAIANDRTFSWTDLRQADQRPDGDDPLSRNVIPSGQLRVLRPQELALNTSHANLAVSGVVRSDEPPENVQRLLDFLRLPDPTQQTLARPRGDGGIRTAVLSNSHRLAALYPALNDVQSTVRAIVASDAILIMTFADAPPEGRVAFETVLLVDGSVRAGWRNATVRVEKGLAAGPFAAGRQFLLGEFSALANVLARSLG